jgi:hypothetical protein
MKKWLIWTIAIVVIAIIILLFRGPLFPWSPLKPGFTKIESTGTTLFINKMAGKDSIVYDLDNILLREEEFHGLTYQDNIRIVVLDKESNMKRYLPWFRGSGYSVSLGMANLIYIGPSARKSLYGIEPYLKHELSHMLIGQNASAEKALKIHRQGWFTEGIAEYYSGHNFYTRDEFLSVCQARNTDFSSLLIDNPMTMPIQDIRFKYTYYKYFIEFLAESHGLPKLRAYLKKYLNEPERYIDLFDEVYAVDLDTLLSEFRQYMFS